MADVPWDVKRQMAGKAPFFSDAALGVRVQVSRCTHDLQGEAAFDNGQVTLVNSAGLELAAAAPGRLTVFGNQDDAFVLAMALAMGLTAFFAADSAFRIRPRASDFCFEDASFMASTFRHARRASPHAPAAARALAHRTESAGSDPFSASSHSRASGTGDRANWWPRFSGAKSRSMGYAMTSKTS